MRKANKIVLSIFIFSTLLVCSTHGIVENTENHTNTSMGDRPNILLILADDLGYGDLSVPGFTGLGTKTPELFKMAKDGLTMTNFHVAAPICTPSRAAILTGLFPWRLGIHSIYGSGRQANEHLPTVPNAAYLFANAGYRTIHIGKWHLGGLRPLDVQKRLNSDCSSVHPGPNQHGFQDFIAMEEGQGSKRLTDLVRYGLYHEGAKYLIHNDQPLNPSEEILTDRQAKEAIRLITESVKKGEKFYMHLWFDAPHMPIELIEEFAPMYEEYKSSRSNITSTELKYKTMISSMDAAIGRIRKALVDLNIAKDTLIVFLSDNGPENIAGSAGPFRGRKRSLNEGGIRVPCIWQWEGKILPHTTTSNFAVSTDLLPTFLEAAGIPHPPQLRLDGQSLLPTLLMDRSTSPNSPTPRLMQLTPDGPGNSWGDERLVTWYAEISGRSGAAWSNGHKYVFDPNGMQHLYQMRRDPKELKELLFFGSSIRSSAVSGKTQVHPRVSSKIHQFHADLLRVNSTSSSELTGVAGLGLTLQKSCHLFAHQGNQAYLSRKEKSFCGVGTLHLIEPLPWEVSPSVIPVF